MRRQTDGLEAFLGALEKIDAIVEQAEANVQRAEALQQSLDALTVVRRSPGREVEVCLDSTGRLTDVTFTTKAEDCTPALLSRIILTTIRSAMDDLREHVHEATLAGGHPDAAAEHVRAEYDRNLSTPLARFRGSETIWDRSRES